MPSTVRTIGGSRRATRMMSTGMLNTFYRGQGAIRVAKYNIFVTFGNTDDAGIVR